jgi:two-component system, OmpR family, response regulator
MKHRILVVAEDMSVRATLARWLIAANYAVELAEGPKRAREVIENETIALAIVAPQRLGAAGLDLACELRRTIGRLIVVTEPSTDAGSQTVAAIESDGSISKPLNETEVLATVVASLPTRLQEESPSSDLISFERHILDVRGRRCRTLNGEDIPLTRGEFTVLLALARQKGRVVSRDELRQAVAGRDAGPDDRSVDVMISRVRRKIERDPKQPGIIVTVPGEGYRLTDLVQSQDQHVPVVARREPYALDQSVIEGSALDVRRSLRRHRALRIGSAALAGIGAVLIALWLSGLGQRGHSPPVLAKFDASAVPLVTDLARSELEAYPSQPNFKAVAISAVGYGVAVGARDAPSAEAQALERCKALSRLYCRLYAIGTDVVWSVKSLPLPLPFDVHDEPLKETFDPAILPLNAPGLMEGLKNYVKSENHRALAFAGITQGIGRFYFFFGAASRLTAARLVVERCVDISQLPCLLASVDGFWTIQVPKSRRIMGLFMLTNEAAMSDEDKQRTGRIYQQRDWRAIARGRAGGWYPVAGAPSETVAVEQALEACARHDSECHIYAISNFRVVDKSS